MVSSRRTLSLFVLLPLVFLASAAFAAPPDPASQGVELCGRGLSRLGLQSLFPAHPPVDLAFRELGSGAQTVLLVHDVGATKETYDAVALLLARNYRVISLDLPGHGASPTTVYDYWPESMALSVARLCEKLGVRQAHVLAHGLGSRVAVHLATERPELVRSIVVEDAEMHRHWDASDEDLADTLVRAEALLVALGDGTADTLDALRAKLADARFPTAALERIIATRAAPLPGGRWGLTYRPHVLTLAGGLAEMQDLRGLFWALPMPVYVLRAETQSAMSALGVDGLVLGRSALRIDTVAGSTHAIHATQTDALVRQAVLFWQAVESSPAPLASPLTPEPNDVNALSPVADEGTTYTASARTNRYAPRGAAVLTSSGRLADVGITAIIHAASGGYGGPEFRPSLDGVGLSVGNSLALARRFGHKRVAVPFIGSGIFRNSIGVSFEVLAQRIVDAALAARGDLELVFVLSHDKPVADFHAALARHPALPPGVITVLEGSITDGALHHATAIVNAANTEVTFGDGMSGAIGNASGQRSAIDAEARDALLRYHDQHP